MAAVADHRGTAHQPGDPEVPHHPAQRRLPEEDIARARSACSAAAFRCSRITAVAVHDALWPPVVPELNNTHSGWSNGTAVTSGPPAARSARGRESPSSRISWAPSSSCTSSAVSGTLVDPAAVEPVSVGAEQDLGFSCTPAARRHPAARSPPAGRPDRADRRGGQEGDHGLGDVGQVSGDGVARPDTQPAQFGGHRADPAWQLGPVDHRAGASSSMPTMAGPVREACRRIWST